MGPFTLPWLTDAEDNIDAAFFVGKYPNAVSGNRYICTASCNKDWVVFSDFRLPLSRMTKYC